MSPLTVQDARRIIHSLSFHEITRWLEATSSCAIEGGELAGRCSDTLYKIYKGKKVSDMEAIELAKLIVPAPEQDNK